MGLLVSTAAVCAEAEEHSGEVAQEEEEYEENVLAFFLGFAIEDRREGAAVGLEYEHRFGESFGLGKTYLAPGIEDGEEGSESLVRIGFEYGFEKGAWEISPQLDVDFVDDEEVYVIGVVFGRGL